jgi:hypothetical protein
MSDVMGRLTISGSPQDDAARERLEQVLFEFLNQPDAFEAHVVLAALTNSIIGILGPCPPVRRQIEIGHIVKAIGMAFGHEVEVWSSKPQA